MAKERTGSTRVERLHTALRRRQDSEKQELFQAILSAAVQLFQEQGYERFSLRQVTFQGSQNT